MIKCIVIGGGAAGFFAALSAKKHFPSAQVFIFERGEKFLNKVKISGGGRCNVTHYCFDPKQLARNYPRGEKELLGPFHTFQPRDTIAWFKERGVPLVAEKDGRMFPQTNTSSTIISCLVNEANRLGVEIKTGMKVSAVKKNGEKFAIQANDLLIEADQLVIATGSGTIGWEIAKYFGHTIIPPVPSLFTFNVPTSPLLSLSGVAVDQAKLSLKGTPFTQTGPLLITHWGFSGPASLKLSAFAARWLAEQDYRATLEIDWCPGASDEEALVCFHTLPKRLQKSFFARLSIIEGKTLSKKERRQLIEQLKRDRYQIEGKTTNKEEFVTCGGVKLSEIDFKTMESKRVKGLYFCGETLDIDGITGGFNFQNAWTTGWIAGKSLSKYDS